jgi:hypothetical protein
MSGTIYINQPIKPVVIAQSYFTRDLCEIFKFVDYLYICTHFLPPPSTVYSKERLSSKQSFDIYEI